MSFSQRQGYKPTKLSFQLGEMDLPLRNALWDAFHIYVLTPITKTRFDQGGAEISFFRLLWHAFYKSPVDTIDNYIEQTALSVRNWFFKAQWYEVYDFIEFVAANMPKYSSGSSKNFRDFCNAKLKREFSGYRFVDDVIAPITSDAEIESVSDSITSSAHHGMHGAEVHLKSAVEKLSDRHNPDYRNSIKEAISAVESVCRVISGDAKAELGSALKAVEDKVGLHPALKKGFSAIYGYTSDENRIRHSLIEQSDVSFADAKYMLISCSAFVSYLILKLEITEEE